MGNYVLVGMSILILLYLSFQCILLSRLVKQNTDMINASDKRLYQANELVVTLSKTSAQIADDMKDMKDLVIHIESVYNSRLDCVTKNRDEIMSAYTKLLAKFEELRSKHETMMEESFNSLKELARRPTLTNNNNS